MKKILVIDDETVITKVLSIRLSDEGYSVEVANDGEDAIDKALKLVPDLSIIDIGLPKVDGDTLCEIFKKNKKLEKMKIIILTGKNLVGDMEDAFKSGADEYMEKPYDFKRLLEKIKKLID